MLPKYKSQILNVFWTNSVNCALDGLSKMINKKIKLLNTSVKIEFINDVPKIMSPKEVSTTLVYTKIFNHLNCVVIVSLSLKHFLRLVDMLLHKKIDYYEALNEENKSSVLELGNIINGYFISSLNDLFDAKFIYDESELSVSPFRAVEDFNFGNIYKKKINALMFISDFTVEWTWVEGIEGKIILLAEEDKVDMMLEAISKKIKMA